MQKAIRDKCRQCREVIDGVQKSPVSTGMTLREFINRSESQIALLGIQMIWTNGIQNALTNFKGNKQDRPNLDP